MRSLVSALALTVAACTAGPAPRGAPPAATPAPDATTSAPTSAPATTPAGSAAPAAPSPASYPDGVSFVTPSRNIACELTPEHTECSIAERTWQPPGERCAGRANAEIFDGRVGLGCGAVGPEAAPLVVGYGESVVVHRVRCAVDRSGVTCRFPSGRGFFLSRARYELFD